MKKMTQKDIEDWLETVRIDLGITREHAKELREEVDKELAKTEVIK